MEKVAAYTRVSTSEQSNGYGLDTQRTKVQQWADLNDVEAVDWYEDTASGGDTDRPGLQEMIDDLRSCEYDALVVYKADRLSRSLKDLLTVIDDVLEPCDTAFVSVTEQFDTSTPSGRLFLQMVGSFSEFERALITERLRDGRRSKAQDGGHAAGEVPFGYTKNADGELVLSDHAETVRRIFRMREDGDSLRAIADTLNAEGIETKRGGEWHASTVSYILKNDKYRGLMRHEIGGETVERERPDLSLDE
jgi:DNA invertase Pin-like site-specific DNA recombinase